SFTSRLAARSDDMSDEDIIRLLNVPSWFPPDIAEWMASLPAWYEDEHALYVHAGLDGDGETWWHPAVGREKPLFWMREPDFFNYYEGKRVVFGHTRTRDLPTEDDSEPDEDESVHVWLRGDLV